MESKSISSRGQRAAQPMLSYGNDFFRALGDMYDPKDNPEGSIVMCIAENKLSFDLLKEKLVHCRDLSIDTMCYTAHEGLEIFRKQVVEFMSEHIFHLDTPMPFQNIVVSAGCGAMVNELVFCLCERGDAVLIPTPYYPAFDNDVPVMAEGVVWRVNDFDGEDGDRLGLESLETARKEAEEAGHPAKILLLTSPGNPLGDLYTKYQLRRAVQWARQHKIHVISDEVYACSVYGSDEFVSVGSLCREMAAPSDQQSMGLGE